MLVIGIIPARYQSSRFPGKSLVPIMGISLLERTYRQAIKCRLLDKLIIATDDVRIFDHAKGFGAEVVMTPVECLNGTERMCHVIQSNPLYANGDIYINIQGDEPCIEPKNIDTLIQALLDSPQDKMATLAAKITDIDQIRSSGTCKCVFDTNGYALYFSRSIIPYAKNDGAVYKHIGIYAFQRDFLLQYRSLPNTPLQLAEDLEQLKVLEHGYKIKVAIVTSDALDVNNPEDIKKVEQYLCMIAKK